MKRKIICFGWLWILTGIIIGAVVSMWAFNGPLAPPVHMEDYTSLSRRFIRLSHIAFIALGMIDILYGLSYDLAELKKSYKDISSSFLITGTVLMPVILLFSAFFEKIKIFSSIPITLILISLMIFCYGLAHNRRV
jgi:hypothetical protein